eukprot:CAMPEP_0113679436 /NCGR_PEP_ID=MMETSP0038_2-20120614/10634_1 /TAXON_ID=2898 /ORGANISM="Cryptomonas paramecium" /LENGTH=513 /DNA_ID=CAMNT_0000597449 /DNA_START=20 /DNA_END=1561 /DNA_ORIENTATION=- /assembly_acc=CAM_ASM_000170
MPVDPNELLSKAQKNDAAGIQAMISKGMNPSVANSVGQTALHVACLWGNAEAAQALVTAKADINAQNNFSGATPLHCAATENARGNVEGRKACVQILVRAGANLEIRDFRSKRAFEYSRDDSVRAVLGGTPFTEEEEEEDDDGYIPDSQKTPVTIVTGFLGAGKTTLVNYILSEKHGKKIAVIENEFGEVNIDTSLVAENLKEKEDVISMDNGCVCCTVRGDLVRAFKTLAQRPEKYDSVIIETTGMADPAPVAFTFNSKPEVGMLYRVDAILCVVDAKHIKQHLDEVREEGVVNEAVQQVAFADKILLNKVDLVTPEEKEEVKKTVRSINAVAKIIECERSRVNLDELLGLGSFSLSNVSHMVEELSDEEDGAAGHGDAHGGGHGAEHGGGHGHGAEEAAAPKSKKPKRSSHLSGVSSVGVTIHGELSERKFNEFMSSLLQRKANDLYRCKGVIKFKGMPEKFVFHGVHEQVHFGPVEGGWAPGEAKIVKMVFIGKNLNRQEITAGFDACRA